MATTLRPNQYPLGATREMEPTTNRHGNAEYQCRSVGIYVPRTSTDRHGNKEDNILLAALTRSKQSKLIYGTRTSTKTDTETREM